MAEHPNWIAERAKCDMAFLWRDVCEIVEKNIQRLNTEAESHHWPRRYGAVQGSENTFQSTGYLQRKEVGTLSWKYDVPSDVVVFRGSLAYPDRISGPVKLDALLETRWDAPTSQCKLVVMLNPNHDPPQIQMIEFAHDELWKAVQYILEPFFFPAD